MLITLDSVVKSALIAEGRSSKDELYWRFLHWAQNTVKELGYDIFGGMKTVKLEVNPNGTASYPKDYVNYSRLFIIKESRIHLLGHNNDIPLLDTYFEDKPEVKVDRARAGFSFYNYSDSNVRDSISYGKEYGIGGGIYPYGYFRIHDKMQRFEFDSSMVESEIFLEYVCRSIECGKETMVDEMAREVIEETVRYQYAKTKKDIKAWVLENQRRDTLNARRRYRHRKLAPSIQEIVDTVRQERMQAVKS